MLSIEVRVNRDLIGHAYIVNRGNLRDEGTVYPITYYAPNGNKKLLEFDIVHKPEQGVEKLVLLVYEEVAKRTKSRSKIDCLSRLDDK